MGVPALLKVAVRPQTSHGALQPRLESRGMTLLPVMLPVLNFLSLLISSFFAMKRQFPVHMDTIVASASKLTEGEVPQLRTE